MNLPTHVIFIGKPQAGKSEGSKTTTKVMASMTAVPYPADDCSTPIKEKYCELRGITMEQLAAWLAEERFAKKEYGIDEVIRPQLVKIGDEMCENDHAALVKALVKKGVKAIAGVRRLKELQEAKEFIIENDGAPLVIWVNSTIADKMAIKDNTEVTEADADISIDNSNRSQEELYEAVMTAVRWYAADPMGIEVHPIEELAGPNL